LTPIAFGCAVIGAMLHRYTGKTDVVFRTQIGGRDEVDIENLIGVFLNNLVIRCDASGDPTFTEFLTGPKSRSWARRRGQAGRPSASVRLAGAAVAEGDDGVAGVFARRARSRTRGLSSDAANVSKLFPAGKRKQPANTWRARPWPVRDR
jgi:hypothetical protein